MIKVIVCGACGRMGSEVVKAINKENDIRLVGAIDITNQGKDIGEIVLGKKVGVNISSDLLSEITSSSPDILVDFTIPSVVVENIRCAIKHKVHCVVGTTGITSENLAEIEKLCKENHTNAIVAPNFAIGAVLLMKFAAQAAKYFQSVEIIEMHHNKKLDAPSGTAIKTAQMIADCRPKIEDCRLKTANCKGEEKIEGVRGGEINGIRIHSVRLPGLVAHQEVIFGGEGQILTLRHDSLSRESFMPGVIYAIRKVREINGLIYGLENLI